MESQELQIAVERFIKESASKEKLYELLFLLTKDGSHSSLKSVISLVESDYDGFTYNYELKYPAAATALFWGYEGVEMLTTMVIQKQKTKDIRIVAEILSFGIRGQLSKVQNIDRESAVIKYIDLDHDRFSNQEFKSNAKTALINIIVNLENDIDLPVSIFNSLL